MTKFVVHTDVLVKDLNPFGMASTVPKMISDAKLNNIAFKAAYPCALSICHCVKDRKVVCEFDSIDESTVRSALTTIGLPATAILAKKN
ncbi:MAG TPA: hypothetical protein VLV31_00010 [Candidatus Acidoferrales bacterium]|nr:hypothetical protein [Candidatus Acidoferrales bacterium]